ncbi:hypothetical protein RO3G_11995 [Rhizopus delemar RA 99-880]|uniref:Uncharacterized protein n=1 Tax=Rhizopus delemar (strain RA 99-880 / ATCC MYA-4621 / FGSC 9543 / NRRL 43880) TaxID=246409 RepID=I1CFQ4_RHIO9|nr:hypothetical protein RO3G_11995 [Rhizopus delemar RA 99-880]|eukprot:EIE87284.1 hypothetical protein RO3G_11995 [Rhizopus delemar RA 99-880]
MYESINIKRASTEALIFCKDVSDPLDSEGMESLSLKMKLMRKPRLVVFILRITTIAFKTIKRPGQPSKYQTESDYVKLMKEMKESVEGQIDLGFDNPVSFGLLVESIL